MTPRTPRETRSTATTRRKEERCPMALFGFRLEVLSVCLRVSAVQFAFVFLGGLGVPLKGVLKRILAVDVAF
jgi:hypothetical protein